MAAAKKWWKRSSFDWYAFGMLIALELLMSFTFLGYIHIPPLSVTTAYIPILIAGALWGPAQSTVLGLTFGLASMYKASASYVLPADAVFSPFSSGAPVGSLLLSVGSRALFGLLIGLAFQFARTRKQSRLYRCVFSALSPKLHSLLVYTAMGLFFPELGYRFYSAFHWRWDDTVFALVCVASVELLWHMYHSQTVQNIKQCMDQSVDNPYTSQKMNIFLVMFEFFLFCMAVSAAVYFSERESYLLGQHGLMVSAQISGDLLHVQLQFVVAFMAMNTLSLILLIAVYRYMAYKGYQGEMDELTGVMGRRMFLQHCRKAQSTSEPDRTGWFLFVDADYFKDINDTFGHATGDLVLREIAGGLSTLFSKDGAVGRIGGDEFAVFIEAPISRPELAQRLDRFLAVLAGTLPDKPISCSIGAYRFDVPKPVKHLLTETDQALYEAKERGRACYVMKEQKTSEGCR